MASGLDLLSTPSIYSNTPGLTQISAGGVPLVGTTAQFTPVFGTPINDSPTNTTGTTDTATITQNAALADLIQGALSRLPGQLQTAQNNIQNQYNTNSNQLQSGYDQAQVQNQQQTTQNQQQYRLNKNQIADKASTGLSSLLRVLGAHGAGGSSDYNLLAPQLVANQATQERAGAGQTYGQNQQAIDTNWNNYQTGFGNSKKQLNDWLSSQLQNAQSNSAQTEIGLQQQLLGLQPSVATAQPYIDRINQLASQVDSLAALNPTYDGKTPTYTAPSVASYNVNPNTAVTQNASASDSILSPYLSLLLGKKQQLGA